MDTRFEIAFRTIRIGSLKTYPTWDAKKLKFSTKEMKFHVILEQNRAKGESIKIVIPVETIRLIEAYMDQGCPVIWVTTDSEIADKIRRQCEMCPLRYPAPYFDPQSKELADQRIAIIPCNDPIEPRELKKFRLLVKMIAMERNIESSEFCVYFSRVHCNEQLVRCTKYISELKRIESAFKTKQESKSDSGTNQNVVNLELGPSKNENKNKEDLIVISSSEEEEEELPYHDASSLIGQTPRCIGSSNEYENSASRQNTDSDVVKEIVSPKRLKLVEECDSGTEIHAGLSETQDLQPMEEDIASDLSTDTQKPLDLSISSNMTNGVESNEILQKNKSGSSIAAYNSPADIKCIRGTAALTCDMQSLHRDMECMLGDTPLCTCVVNSQYIINTANHKITCMAIDNIDGRLTGCINLAAGPHMLRSSRNLPAHALCKEHKSRMFAHECCPGCGTFCAGGTFLVCNNTSEQHRFHRNCLVLMRHTMDCPHCGSGMSNVFDVTVDPCSDYLKKFERSESEVVEKSPDKRKWPRYPDCVVCLPGVTKPVPESVINEVRIEFLPDRESLDVMVSTVEEDLPKKLRFQAKNFIQLVKQGELVKAIQLLCGTVANPNARHPGNLRTALHEAVSRGNLAMTHFLVTVGADVNLQDENGQTPLFYAEEQNRLDLMKYLLTCRANLRHGDSDGMTSLHHSAKDGRLKTCLALLKYDSKCLNSVDEGGWTPLVWAAEHRRVAVARCLTYYNTNVHAVDKEGNICLQWAALAGNTEILQMCLRTNSNVDHQNILGDTALHIAAREDNRECVVILLAWGANPLIRNREGRTPAQSAKDPSLCQVALIMNTTTRCAISDHKGFEPLDRERLLSTDISRGKEKICISCVNAVDEAPCPVNPPHEFLYISKNVYKYTSVNAIIPKTKSCRCMNDCLSCECCDLSDRCWYDSSGRLLPAFDYKNPPHIYECNPLCKCPRSCRNRVIQKGGVRFRIQVFRTMNIGWGVRTLEPILRGSFVCEFIGEVISDGEAREDNCYLFDLEDEPGGPFCIDGRSYGNVSRYINHHCEPNLAPVRFFYDHQDKNFPRVAFFATRDIAANEQLGFDYGDDFWDEKCEHFTCQCGAKTCRYSEQAYRTKKMENLIAKS